MRVRGRGNIHGGVECLVIGQALDCEKNEQIARRRIVAGKGNPEESWRNNNSPATGRLCELTADFAVGELSIVDFGIR